MKFLVTVVLALVLLDAGVGGGAARGLALIRIDVTVVLVAFLALRAGTAGGRVLRLRGGLPAGYDERPAHGPLHLPGRASRSCSAGWWRRWWTCAARVAFALFAMGADVGHGAAGGLLHVADGEGRRPRWRCCPGCPLQVALTGAAALALYPLLRKLRSRGRSGRRAGLLR